MRIGGWIAVLIAISLSAACSSRDNANANAPSAVNPAIAPALEDSEIKVNVQRNLRERGLEEVDLEVKNGEVILWGRADTWEQTDLAGRTARETPGVANVDNRIKVVVEKLYANPKRDTAERAKRVGEKQFGINLNKPGGPRKDGVVNLNKPGGPRRDGKH